jgi:hypothetical protein
MMTVRKIMAVSAAALAQVVLAPATQAQDAVPAALAAPGDQVVARVSAAGVQVYECRPGADGALAWAFKEPRAALSLDGKPVGRHYAGPTWEHADGSRIVGRPVASLPAPGAGDIPWLRLTVASRAGDGAFAPVTAVQRVDTRGGTLAGRCDAAGALSEVPYTADYVMLRAAS